MGTRSEACANHKKLIAKLRGDDERTRARITEQREKATEARRKSANLAFDAVSGKSKAVSAQLDYDKEAEGYEKQAQNLEYAAAHPPENAPPIRQQLAAAEAALPPLILAEARERIIEEILELPSLGQKLSDLISPIADSFAEFRDRIDSVFAQALPVLDRSRIAPLESKFRTCVVRAVRAQLATDFQRKGLHLLDRAAFEPETFQIVVEPLLKDLVAALESNQPAGGSSGLAAFRATTNISGLFGMTLRVGDTISLAPDNPEVLRLVEAGALTRDDVANAAGGSK